MKLKLKITKKDNLYQYWFSPSGFIFKLYILDGGARTKLHYFGGGIVEGFYHNSYTKCMEEFNGNPKYIRLTEDDSRISTELKNHFYVPD